MVARITTPHRINETLNYNEQKVNKGKAECIHAGNYLKEGKDMNFYQKLAGFEHRNMLNDRATTKTLHISLNFSPSETFSKERLVEIANSYMAKIGFEAQPYLVYKHEDAGHPHIHIVATTIKEDGSRINTHNIGRNQSEKARKEIEQLFNLLKAERQTQLVKQPIRAIDLQKIVYGKDETKSSIGNVVNAVISKYKFTSFPEFNAVLRQFNVMADRGKEDGRIFKHGGLIYRILDEKGNKIGVPVKASSLSNKPILKKLEEKFTKNQPLREPDKQQLKETIDTTITRKPVDMKEFITLLAKEQINTVLRQNNEGRIYGITFVDNKSCCVFNGSDLGRNYSAAGIGTRLNGYDTNIKENPVIEKEKTSHENGSAKSVELSKTYNQESKEVRNTLLEQLMAAGQQNENIPFQLKRKRKKKKKKITGV